MQRRLSLLLIIGIYAAFAPVSGPAAESEQLARSNEILLELQRYEARLEDLESEFGPFDNSLLEPLESIAQLMIEQGDYQGVAQVQTRRLGVMRTVLGLEHPDLIPAVQDIIANQKRLGNWEAVSDNLDLIRLIIAANHGNDSDEALEAIDNQARWLLSMLYLDQDRREQARNFMKAREFYDDLLDLAEDRFGEEDPALYPWYYKRAHSLALLVGLLNTDDGLAGEVVERVIREDGFGRLEQGARRGRFDPNFTFGINRRFPVVTGDEVFGAAYLRQGRGYIDDIADIAEAGGDIETRAMTEIYRGDFNVLLDRNSGSRNYREARELLIEAGIDAPRIDKFFSIPMPIPIPDFYSRFAELEAYQQQRLAQVETAAEDLTYLGVFAAWAEAAPTLEKPLNPNPLLNVELPQNRVQLSFNLSSRGSASAINVLSAEPRTRRIEREASRALRDIKFRPYFSDDRSRRLRDLRIVYEFAVEE